jgi:hypothetical protein
MEMMSSPASFMQLMESKECEEYPSCFFFAFTFKLGRPGLSESIPDSHKALNYEPGAVEEGLFCRESICVVVKLGEPILGFNFAGGKAGRVSGREGILLE